MLSDRSLVIDALRLLADFGWLRVSRYETGGRTATVFTVNPKCYVINKSEIT